MSNSDQPSPSRPTLEGGDFVLDSAERRLEIIERAFDYRGDVTVHTHDGQVLDGYLFDRRKDVPEPYFRMLLRDSTEKITVPYALVCRLVFSGRDTAAGKSWETWVKHHKEKKAKGEAANLDPEPL